MDVAGQRFHQLIEDLGVERRLFTGGEHKGIRDPFDQLSAEDRGFLLGLLDQLRGKFIGVVKESRGTRLKGGPEPFTVKASRPGARPRSASSPGLV
jgi:protease-4